MSPMLVIRASPAFFITPSLSSLLLCRHPCPGSPLRTSVSLALHNLGSSSFSPVLGIFISWTVPSWPSRSLTGGGKKISTRPTSNVDNDNRSNVPDVSFWERYNASRSRMTNRPAFVKASAIRYDDFGKIQPEADDRSSQKLASPVHVYSDTLTKIRPAEGGQSGNTQDRVLESSAKDFRQRDYGRPQAIRPTFNPTANDINTIGRSERESSRSSSTASSAAASRGRSNFNRANVKTSSSQEKGRTDRLHSDEYLSVDRGSSAWAGSGSQDGYKFREQATDIGEFRRIVSGRRFTDGKGEQMEDAGRQIGKNVALDRDSEGTDSSTSSNSFEKYPPRRLEGEKRWQYAVRKKQMGKKQMGFAGHSRGSTRKSVQKFVDDEQLGDEPQGDEWRRRKVAWLCKQIPTLRPRPVVTILNDQRKWINAIDSKYVVEHLLQINQTLRAHRVLKWEMQQPWHEFDFDLSTKVAVQLGQNNKLSRTRDIYNLIIRNGQVPDLPTYVALINCYIADCENESLGQAWSLYNQMTKMAQHEPPPTLRYNLFQGLVQKGPTFLEQADEMLLNIRMAGLVCSSEMYSLLILAHGTKGNQDRVTSLILEMKEDGLSIGQEVYTAVLKACAKEQNVAAGEQAFSDLKLAGHKPNQSAYSSLITIFGKAGLTEKAFQTFEEMKNSGIIPTVTTYEKIMEVAVLSNKREEAEKLLAEARERCIPSLQGCYNSVIELYSNLGLFEELETVFLEMRSNGYPPNHASVNLRLGAYVRHGLVNKADTIYEDMKHAEKLGPNGKTYELMLKLYGEAKNYLKVREVFKEISGRGMEIPERCKCYVEAAVGAKKLEAHRKSQLKLDKEQREILAGVLLAGAGIESHDKNRTYELHFGLDPDSEVGLPLLNHLFNLFSAWSTGPPSRQVLADPKVFTKPKTLLAFQTVSHGSFRFFAHQYRPKVIPVIPMLIHRWLTPRALAYWYMYGGTRCPQSGWILFNVTPYTHKEGMLVVNALKSRSIDCEKIGTKDGAAICIKDRSAMWLWGLVEPYILPNVRHLLRPDEEGLDEDE